MSALFEFRDLSGGYDDTQILSRISSKMDAGDILGVFGRNGVGKSTLGRLLYGELGATSGRITHAGNDVTALKAFARRKSGIGYMPQTRMVFDDLTVRENLSLSSNKTDIDLYFDRFPRLAERLDQPAGTMSGGERKILAFVRAMIEDTTLVILDEPSEGVQPENIENMAKILCERAAAGIGILLIEQNINFLMRTATHLMGIDAGQTVLQGQKTGLTVGEVKAVLSV
jgi:ABC-type branched-subunit amino acid transport system ATPase component